MKVGAMRHFTPAIYEVVFDTVMTMSAALADEGTMKQPAFQRALPSN